MSQLKILNATTKAWCSQINKYLKKTQGKEVKYLLLLISKLSEFVIKILIICIFLKVFKKIEV